MCAKSVIESIADGYTVFLCADGQAHIQRFKDLFLLSLEQDEVVEDLIPEKISEEEVLRNIKWIDSTLSTGFICHELRFTVITEHQLFERKHFQKSGHVKRFSGISLKDLQQMHIGDYVVHVDKGIGQYDGLVTITINQQQQECVRLLYHGSDVLFVHLNNIHKIQKYSAQEASKPTLSRLGSSEWEKKKQKTKKRIKDIARELIKLYAMRKSEPGFQFPVDTHWQKEFEASFMYEDTVDQAKATEDVKRDMESTIPMDRLVCGDVGFGKTEVAIRAAFKAVQAGKQVAVLVPTTILAHQHFHTFSDRLRHYPVKVEVISRFRQHSDQKNIVDDITTGKIDILIGTHRILSKDIQFKDLGLLIIDEEQRFGVGAKEKLRNLRVSVDTLTLTATPIPRTLNFSLMGARDLSVIETPPRNRLPVNTVIHEWDDTLLHESISREIGRGGQIYVVNDNIKDLDAIHQRLLSIFPSIRCAKAHGQMESDQLEKVMEAFLEKKIDCLLSTKIVESGLDIPNANTIIINHADNFGLAELYQLRGRVGRSNTQAYCHLIIPPIQTITPQAVRRLQALEEFTELGSGFHLAMRDLEIRGAGNLLGAEQSGFIADMGLELYQTILEEAVSELKEDEFSDLFKGYVSDKKNKKVNLDIAIDISSDALIPAAYISHDGERFEYYRRLYNVRSESELLKIISEIIDRYGPLPEVVENLIFAIRLRVIALSFGFNRLVFKNNVLSIEFPPDNNSAFYHTIFPGILDAVATGEYGSLINQDNKVFLHIPCDSRDTSLHILSTLQRFMIPG
jgi:transcription-repair coupling factor (superfamily II helicase)